MIYVVRQGDTLYTISNRTGVPVWKIAYDNQILNTERLAVGQALLILQPGEEGSYRRGMYVTGYAYPFIEPYVLEQALPALNELLVFSYGFTFEGELVPPWRDDLWIIMSSCFTERFSLPGTSSTLVNMKAKEFPHIFPFFIRQAIDFCHHHCSSVHFK